MKQIFSIALTFALAFSASSAAAQTKKKTKAKAKTKTEKPIEDLPKKDTPALEVTPEMTAPPTTPVVDPNAATPPVAPVTADAPTETPAETKPYTPTTGNEHLFGFSAAIGLPHPMRFGLNYVHSSRVFSVELGYGSFSLSSPDQVTFKMTNTELGLRYHPFYGSFFIGAMFGSRTVSAAKTETIASTSVNAQAEVKGNYIAPYLGWTWGGGSSGLFASMDLGYLSPSSPTTTFTTNAGPAITGTADYQRLDADVKKGGKDIGETGLPIWTMIRLGYLF